MYDPGADGSGDGAKGVLNGGSFFSVIVVVIVVRGVVDLFRGQDGGGGRDNPGGFRYKQLRVRSIIG